MVDIFIFIVIMYTGFQGFKSGGLKELSNTIAYLFGFMLARFLYSYFSNILTILIYQDYLRDKMAFLISFLFISYIFKILLRMIENLIKFKLKKHYLGFIFGILNSIMIISLFISVFKEILPISFNIEKTLTQKSILYKNLDILQKNYLIQYKK